MGKLCVGIWKRDIGFGMKQKTILYLKEIIILNMSVFISFFFFLLLLRIAKGNSETRSKGLVMCSREPHGQVTRSM